MEPRSIPNSSCTAKALFAGVDHGERTEASMPVKGSCNAFFEESRTYPLISWRVKSPKTLIRTPLKDTKGSAQGDITSSASSEAFSSLSLMTLKALLIWLHRLPPPVRSWTQATWFLHTLFFRGPAPLCLVLHFSLTSPPFPPGLSPIG